MSDGLIKRLREHGKFGEFTQSAMMDEAATALVAKEAENARLREALLSVADYMPKKTDHPLIIIVRMAGLARAALNTQHKGETP